MNKRRTMAGLLVAAALMTTGCGGGDEKTADPASSTSTQSSSSSVGTTAAPDTGGSSEGSLRDRFDAAPVGELSPELVADIIKANKDISYSSMMTRFGGKKAWLLHLRGQGAPVKDAQAEKVVQLAAGDLPEAASRIVGHVAPELAGDQELVDAVVAAAEQLEQLAS